LEQARTQKSDVKSKITFIGSGNVATNLAHAFDKAGHTINQIISTNIDHAKALASKFGAYYGNASSELYADSDFILICVNDEAYSAALALVSPSTTAIVCHTAGPVSMNALSSYTGGYGVLYPLQSLRKEEVKDLMQVPIFVEGNSAHTTLKIAELADSISNNVSEVSSEQRAKYHLAAVFANNFTNLMYAIADDYLSKEGLDFNKLLPIITETAIRLKDGKPKDWQTGPAKRGDNEVIDKHISMLEDSALKNIYKQLSDYIKMQ
jgi:predicted short-subunit dehydrogenase-like oxidoreductase (DUF2520 family)